MNNSYYFGCQSGLNRQLSELMQWLRRGRSTALLKNLKWCWMLFPPYMPQVWKTPFAFILLKTYQQSTESATLTLYQQALLPEVLLFTRCYCLFCEDVHHTGKRFPLRWYVYNRYKAQFQQKQLPREQLCKSKDMREMSQHVGVIWYRRKLLSILSRKSPMLLTLLN